MPRLRSRVQKLVEVGSGRSNLARITVSYAVTSRTAMARGLALASTGSLLLGCGGGGDDGGGDGGGGSGTLSGALWYHDSASGASSQSDSAGPYPTRRSLRLPTSDRAAGYARLRGSAARGTDSGTADPGALARRPHHDRRHGCGGSESRQRTDSKRSARRRGE
jgi:hypothetical protein